MTNFSSKRPLTDAEEAEIQRMIASDPENPESTEEELKSARPFAEMFTQLAANMSSNIHRRSKRKVKE